MEFDTVEVHQGETAHAGLGQLDGNLAAEAAQPDNHDSLVGEGADLEYALAAREEFAAGRDKACRVLLKAVFARNEDFRPGIGIDYDYVCRIGGRGGHRTCKKNLGSGAESMGDGVEMEVHHLFALPFVGYA